MQIEQAVLHKMQKCTSSSYYLSSSSKIRDGGRFKSLKTVRWTGKQQLLLKHHTQTCDTTNCKYSQLNHL